jgi:ABC-2 type transport system ATP-binding protein
MDDNDLAVRVTGLQKRYGAKRAVDGLDLTVARGEIVAVLGPNGAGKTTTVEILEGYRRRDGGDVRVLGQDPQTAGRDWRARIGIDGLRARAPLRPVLPGPAGPGGGHRRRRAA